LEQLLEEERQTFEENRKSVSVPFEHATYCNPTPVTDTCLDAQLLKEAQIRDNLADIRIAGAEGDWKSKVEELEVNLQNQREDTDRMRANYEEEIRLLKETHSREQAFLQQEKSAAVAQAKIDGRNAHDKIFSLENRVVELVEDIETEKSDAITKIQKMQEEMDNSEQARDEIKQKLAQARGMVAAAEHDWMEKNSALEKVMKVFGLKISSLNASTNFKI
jgi:hypothetical protein